MPATKISHIGFQMRLPYIKREKASLSLKKRLTEHEVYADRAAADRSGIRLAANIQRLFLRHLAFVRTNCRGG